MRMEIEASTLQGALRSHLPDPDVPVSTSPIATGKFNDSFYVRDRDDEKIFDTDYLREIERAIRHAIQRTFAPLEERNG